MSCGGLNVIAFTKHPKILASKWDVHLAGADTEQIRIPALPLENYRYLIKFKRLKDVDFYWEGADDAKLREFSNLTFSNLQQVGLLDCPAVTDAGIRALAKFPTLRGLGLEGTSITDASLEWMATNLSLIAVNVANCKGVTRKGIQSLALCPSLTELGFSADGWTDAEVVELIDSFKNVTWCGITDPESRLNTSLLKAKGKAKGVQIVVKPTAALQESRSFRSKNSLR